MAREQVGSTETFTYSDGALATVSSGAWTSLNPTSATPSVETGKFYSPHSAHAVARIEAGTWATDQYAKITISSLGAASAWMGVVVRASADVDGNRDYYFAVVEEGAGPHRTVIGKVVNGSITELSSNTGDSWANGESIELEAEGTTLTVFKNGVALRNVTDSDISGSSSHRAGVIAIAGNIRGDDWEGGHLTASTPQLLAPIQDISAGTWLPSSGSPAELWQMIDGEKSPDTDYDYTTSAGTMEVKLAPGSTPSLQTGHTLRYRLRGNGTCDALVKLKCGSTVIAQWTETNVPATDTDYEHTLDSSPSFTISDYTDLRISVEAVP
jgi:hypothetical protein